MRTVRLGIIGCGLIGREFASATARWSHLTEMNVRPEIVAVCRRHPELLKWYTDNFDSIELATDDHRELLACDAVEAVYCAVPHNLHEQFYCDTIEAGKHLLGEKPFGIDKPANDAILSCIREHPEVFVRCSSQMPFCPAVQRIGDMIEAGAFGRIIEVNTGFLHSSDLNPDKPINWKRTIAINGEYGCMGDLGMHACHVPFRAGWRPLNVRACLSNIMKVRPDGEGNSVPCETWDNAVLLCECVDGQTGETFPWTMKTQRIAPGEMNTWYLEILGTRASARFSLKNPRLLEVMEYGGGEQAWQKIDMGYQTAFKAITGGIFEFGFPDAILQMWAGFLYELANARPLKKFAGCVTPEETALSHRLFTAALESQETCTTVALPEA